MNYDKLFSKLWADYTEKNPQALKIYESFVANGEKVINDHIAFRTFNLPETSIEVLSKAFLEVGFVEKGSYVFEQKKLFAKHFEHPERPDAPRVFISELKIEEFSPELQKTVKEIVGKIPQQILQSPEIILAGNQWGKPSHKVYEKLREESEYAAWLYVNGFTVNHFTVSVTHLEKMNDIYAVNDFLKNQGYLMNDGAGEVQGTPEELLEQSSVKAELKDVEFEEGTYQVPACYYEFAKRYPDANGKLYNGFIAKSADKIFQSTDFYEK
ncbi:MAG: DUF1338 domain-containing protein [Bacteroidales bacterium]|nr:DUF1338 domain-containing protein [Bacteroidales bacterium]